MLDLLKKIYMYIFDIFALGLSSSTWDLLLSHTDSLVVGLVASQHVGPSSLTRDQTHVPCITR